MDWWTTPDAEFSQWLDSIAGFDRDLWWCPIICTHRSGAGADGDCLGIVFEHVESRQTYWAPRVRAFNPERTLTENPMLRGTRLDSEEVKALRDRPDVIEHSQAWFGRGSLNAKCPRGCEHRIPRETWDDILGEARRVAPPWVDLSLYGGTSP